MKKNNVLFELTVENIPKRFIVEAKKQLQSKITQLLKLSRLEYGDITIYATHRRFVVIIKDVSPQTQRIVEKVYGPPARLLKDEKGNFTKTAIGFAKSCNINPENLKIEVIEKKGEVICAEKHIPSEKAEKILSRIFYEAIKSLEFPKNMIWEEEKFLFARPIRNVVAIYGNKIIPIKIAQVKSSKTTYSSYFTGFKKINIKNPEEYLKIMENNHIVINDEERKKAIMNIISGVEHFSKCEVNKDIDIIEENMYLCEHPSGVVVKFPSEFLKLPPELLNLVLKKQLKFFSCYDKKGNMIAAFLGIRDGVSKGHRNVEEGYLNVFKARCSDAIFFYETDLKTDIKVFEEKLKNLIFQKELGSMYDKTARVKNVLSLVMKELNIEKKELIDASSFIYYDLVSNVVNEFSELEGVMNYYYANKYGIVDEEIKKAISEIYLGGGNDLRIPSNIFSSILAVSHKIDTLVGDFIVDVIPSGSNDPHGLRRYANGIFRIINENGINLNLLKLIKFSYNSYPEDIRGKKKIEILQKEVLDFIYQRMESYYSQKSVSQDILNSLKNIFLREGDILKLKYRVESLSLIKNRDDFKNISLLYKRLKNIIKDFKLMDVNESIFEKDEEKRLYSKYIEIEKELNGYLNENKYSDAINLILRISNELEAFFENVMVMVESEKIRNNRLSLLKKIYNLFSDISDISQIVY